MRSININVLNLFPDNMKIVAGYLQKSDTFGGPTNDWVGIYEECATWVCIDFWNLIIIIKGYLFGLLTLVYVDAFRILYQEIDYINEGKNADRFRRDFRNIKWVRVPVCFLLLSFPIYFFECHFLMNTLDWNVSFSWCFVIDSLILDGILGLHIHKGVDFGICTRFSI